MRWVEPLNSKKKVKRAGEKLIGASVTFEQKMHAMDVLSNWRAAHAYPMHTILIVLRRKATEIDKSAIVVQRLKRTPSIIGKLKRFDKMKLHRMQDIGGCRAVVKSSKQAERLSKSFIDSKTRHKLHKVDNYISDPKESGYRGIHLVYKYNGRKIKFKDIFVEIQLRSRIQHSWATAVEIVDTFTNQALKASQGEQNWLNFFRYVSAEFAKLESRPIGKDVDGINTLSEAKWLDNMLAAIDRLKAYAVTTDYIGQKSINKTDYFVLELEENASKIKVIQYTQDQLQVATDKYLELEKRATIEAAYDVVLVSASSIHNLKAAYPNYFADSKEFIKYYSKIS